jgi:hypothetical protein
MHPTTHLAGQVGYILSGVLLQPFPTPLRLRAQSAKHSGSTEDHVAFIVALEPWARRIVCLG